MKNEKILIIGSCGQIGTDLVVHLRKTRPEALVVASDVRKPPAQEMADTPFELLDVTDKSRLQEVVRKHHINQVYLLAAMLSATGEKSPLLAWNLNMTGLLNVLELAKEKVIQKVFWPSSIAVFGPTTPTQDTSQITVTEPNTIYGISKLAGERWCEYYFQKYNVDVRSVRYPGVIGYRAKPGGGTTDYAVHIFHEALKNKPYTCFLAEDTRLPMIYMDDAIKATVGIMEVPAEKIKIRSSYNIAGMSFSPKEIATAIKKHIPDFQIHYEPDERQHIASGWPQSIDDHLAREHWGWNPTHDLSALVKAMLTNLPKMEAEQPK